MTSSADPAAQRGRLAHPFERIPAGRLREWFVPVFALAALSGTGVFLGLHAGPGFPELARLSFAGNVERAEAVLAGWSASDRLHIAWVNGLDYLFGLASANVMALACVWAARVFRHRWLSPLGTALAWTSWGFGLLDLPENFAYWSMVRAPVVDPWPIVLKITVVARIVITAAVAEYAVLAFLVRLVDRGRRTGGLPRRPGGASTARGR